MLKYVILALPACASSPLFAAAAEEPQKTIIVIGEKGSLSLTSPAGTGSRLDLTPLETPASVDIIAGETIRQRGDLTVQQAVSRAAGITGMGAVNNGGAVLTSRGFSGQNSVVELYDGVRLDTVGLGSVSYPFDTWTADRIEVLRGPASVLYGSGAIGGAINVVPRKPSREWITQARVSYGSYDANTQALDSGGPLGPVLSYRFDISRQASDNWVDRAKSDSLAIAGAVRADLAPNLSSTISYDYSNQHPMTYEGTPLINGQLDKSLRFKNFTITDPYVRWTDRWLRATTEWAPSSALTLSNTTYYLNYSRYWHLIETYTYNPVTKLVNRTNFTENRHYRNQSGTRTQATWQSEIDGMSNSLLGGVDLSWNHYRTSSYPVSGPATSVDPYANFAPGYYTTINYASLSGTRATMRQISGFAEDRLQLAKSFSIVGGLRYDSMKLHNTNRATNARVYNKLNYLSWRIGSVYNLLPTVVLYAQYATGSDPISTQFSTVSSKLTTGNQVEAGVKAAFWQSRGEFTFAAYKIIKHNLITQDPNNPTVGIPVGQQSSQGLEANLALTLAKGFRIEANGAVLKAQYDDFKELVSGRLVSRDGNVPTNVPETMANLWAYWDLTSRITANAGLRYVGRRFANTANSSVAPHYTVLDANISYAFNEHISATFRVNNVTNKIYMGGNSAFNSGNQWILSSPRAVALEVNARL